MIIFILSVIGCFLQFIQKGFNIEVIIGYMIITSICLWSLFLIRYIKGLPAFAISSIIGFVLTIPNSPLFFITQYTNLVDIVVLVLPIVSAISLSCGKNISKLKNISWKLIIISVIIYVCSYFGCALVAEFMLRGGYVG